MLRHGLTKQPTRNLPRVDRAARRGGGKLYWEEEEEEEGARAAIKATRKLSHHGRGRSYFFLSLSLSLPEFKISWGILLVRVSSATLKTHSPSAKKN